MGRKDKPATVVTNSSQLAPELKRALNVLMENLFEKGSVSNILRTAENSSMKQSHLVKNIFLFFKGYINKHSLTRIIHWNQSNRKLVFQFDFDGTKYIVTIRKMNSSKKIDENYTAKLWLYNVEHNDEFIFSCFWIENLSSKNNTVHVIERTLNVPSMARHQTIVWEQVREGPMIQQPTVQHPLNWQQQMNQQIFQYSLNWQQTTNHQQMNQQQSTNHPQMSQQVFQQPINWQQSMNQQPFIQQSMNQQPFMQQSMNQQPFIQQQMNHQLPDNSILEEFILAENNRIFDIADEISQLIQEIKNNYDG